MTTKRTTRTWGLRQKGRSLKSELRPRRFTNSTIVMIRPRLFLSIKSANLRSYVLGLIKRPKRWLTRSLTTRLEEWSTIPWIIIEIPQTANPPTMLERLLNSLPPVATHLSLLHSQLPLHINLRVTPIPLNIRPLQKRLQSERQESPNM